LIVHVIDASSPHAARQRASVLGTLLSLPSLDAATVAAAVEAHNKADKLTPQQRSEWVARHGATGADPGSGMYTLGDDVHKVTAEQRSEWVARHAGAAAGAAGTVRLLEGDSAGRGQASGEAKTHEAWDADGDGDAGANDGSRPDVRGGGNAVLISAQEGDGCDELLQLITRRLREASPRRRYALRIGSAGTAEAGHEHTTGSGRKEESGFRSSPREKTSSSRWAEGSPPSSRFAEGNPRSSRSDEGIASAQLAFLHSRPLVTVHGTRAAADGVTLLADVEMDELTYRTFVGRWGQGVIA
jgi:hypothetical protein